MLNLLSIVSRVKFEAVLSGQERSQLVNFSKMGSTGLQSNNGLSRLFSNRIYDSAMMYRVAKKARNLEYDNTTDCMLNLDELDSCHEF